MYSAPEGKIELGKAPGVAEPALLQSCIEKRDLRRDEALRDNTLADGYLSRRLISAEVAILPSFT